MDRKSTHDAVIHREKDSNLKPFCDFLCQDEFLSLMEPSPSGIRRFSMVANAPSCADALRANSRSIPNNRGTKTSSNDVSRATGRGTACRSNGAAQEYFWIVASNLCC